MPTRRPWLFVAEVVDDSIGGMSRHFRFLGEELVGMGRDIHYVFLDRMPKPLSKKLQGFSLDLARRALQGVTSYIENYGEPSLVYWSVNSALLFTFPRRRYPQIPLVGMTFGVEERWWPEYKSDSQRPGGPKISLHSRVATGWLRMMVLRASMRRCDHLICVSSEDQRYLISQCGLPQQGVSFIPVGVSHEFLLTKRPSSGTKILFVGTWIWRKGVRYLVEALTRLWSNGVDCQLSLVGTLQEASVVLDYWPEQFRHRVRVVPEVKGAALIQEYSDHDIFVLPSLFEGMPLSLGEAMASGLAVVTTCTCGMQDLVEHRQNGLLVPPRDSWAIASALAELCSDPALRRQLGDSARNTMEALTWRVVAKKFAGVFDRLSVRPLS